METDDLVNGISSDDEISEIKLQTYNMLTKNLKNDKDGFYLIDYNNLSEDCDDAAQVNNHVLKIKNKNIFFNICEINNDLDSNSFFLFYNGILVAYKQCKFETNGIYILCHPLWTCSFTKILNDKDSLTFKTKYTSSVIVMLEKIKESFKSYFFYFPIYEFARRKSLNIFLEIKFKIILLDDNKKISSNNEKVIGHFLNKKVSDIEAADILTKRIITLNTKGELNNNLLPKTSSFFSDENPFKNKIFDCKYNCFLIYSPEPIDGGDKIKSKKKQRKSKIRKSNNRLRKSKRLYKKKYSKQRFKI